MTTSARTGDTIGRHEDGPAVASTTPTRDTGEDDSPMHPDTTNPTPTQTTESWTIEEILVGFSPGESYHFEVNVHPLDQPDPYFEVDVYRNGTTVGWAQDRSLETAVLRAIVDAANREERQP